MTYQRRRISTMGRIRQVLRRMIFRRGRQMRRFWGIDSDIDFEAEVEDAGHNDIVSSMVGWKQDVFPEAPLRLRRMDNEGKMQPVSDHPALNLIGKPNSLYGGLSLWKATIWDYAIDGNAFWMLVPSKAGELMELHYLPRYMMEPGSSTEQDIEDRYWEYSPEGKPEILPANRVLHFRDGIDPNDVRLGCSPLKNLFREMYTDSMASTMVAVLLKNRAVFGPIISPEEAEHDQGNIEEMKEYIMEKFTGDRRGDPLVLGAPTRVSSFGYDSNDSEVTAIRFMVEARIGAALNVPPIVVNLGSGMQHSTYNNVASAREMAWENGMIPMMRDLADVLNTDLLPMMDDDEKLALDFDLSQVRVLQEDRNKMSTRGNNGLRNGKITRAEAREAEGLPFDETDDVFYLPSGLQVVPRGMTVEEMMSKAEPAPPEPEVDDEQEDEQEEMERSLPEDVRLRVDADAFMADLIDGFDEALVEATSDYGKEIESFFEHVAEELYDGNTDSMSKWVTIAVDSDEDLATIANEVDAVFDTVKANDLRDGNLTPIYEELTETVMERAVGTVNSSLGVSVNLPDPVQRQVIADGGKRVGLIDVDQQNKDALFRALHTARSEGMGVPEAGKLLREHLEAGPYTNKGVEYRAHMVARTEAKHAQRVSSLATYDEAGWQVMALDAQLGDDVSDPDCIARNGKIFTVEDAARETDSATVHPNCTLTWVPHIP